MASVTPPTAADVIRYCGLSRYVTGESQTAFETRLASFITDAINVVALRVGEASYDGSSWTARQAAVLAQAVAYQAGAYFLLAPEVRKLLGVQEPLLMEDADAIDSAAERLETRTREMVSHVTAGTELVPFAMPAVSSSTFTVGKTDRTPTEKYELTDERDDLSADDTEHG